MNRYRIRSAACRDLIEHAVYLAQTAVRSRGHFPNDDAAIKLIFLVLRRIERDWKMPPREWTAAKTQFAIMFGERFIGA